MKVMGRLLVTKSHALVATSVNARKMVFRVGRSLLSNCTQTRGAKNIQEKNIFIMGKLLVIIYYLGAYVLALQTFNSLNYYIISNCNFIGYPVLSIGYGYLLRKRRLQ